MPKHFYLHPSFSLPLLVISLSLILLASAQAQSSPSTDQQNPQLLSHVESYLRVLFGWGPEYKIKLGSPTTADIPSLEKIAVSVNDQGNNQEGTIYVTKDGRYMFRGEIRDMSKDPFAETRAKIKANDAPSVGPADAKLTVVEFSDFECPHCQEFYSILKQIEPEFPQVRFVYKNFPIEQIHPWAMSAALTGHCVFKHSTEAFLRFQDSVFTNQSAITADSAWDMLTQYAVSAGTSADELHSCMTDPATKAAVDADVAEGKSVGMETTGTPTFFVNGRLVTPADKTSLEQIIRFDLARVQPSAPAAPSAPLHRR